MTVCLELQHVTVAYDGLTEIRTALNDVDVRLHQGEWLAIVGRNGSGKSTLARVMAGLSPISKGKLQKPEPAGLSTQMSIVFQNPDAQIVGDTVYEDVSFGLLNRAVPASELHTRVHRALAAVGLGDYSQAPVHTLSGGQKQRLCIASALALNSDGIIFDEATSMLDPMARQQVISVAKALHERGAAVVWVTQWLDELAYADRVLALADGSVSYDGAPRQFFYGGTESTATPCEAMGFTLPFVVQVARQMAQSGRPLAIQPLTPTELVEAVFPV